jgi:hypothetical protein
MSESHHRSRVRSTSGTITYVMIVGEPWESAEEEGVRFTWSERREGAVTIQTLSIMIPGMQVVIGPQDLEDERDNFGGQER